VAAATRLRGGARGPYAAFLAAGLALLVHAGLDWDWEMPAVFVWLFLAGGMASARREPGPAPARRPLGRTPRLVAGLACLLVAVTPVQVAASQSALDRAGQAFARGDCATAVDAALDARDRLSVRPEPFELIGYCDLRAGQDALAVAAMRDARSRDPDNWQYAYGEAVALALSGQDPRDAARAAVARNPLSTLARRFLRAVDGPSPARWRRAGERARLPGG
jgi:hypothetical protein